jgi:hypothetical protein
MRARIQWAGETAAGDGQITSKQRSNPRRQQNTRFVHEVAFVARKCALTGYELPEGEELESIVPAPVLEHPDLRTYVVCPTRRSLSSARSSIV